MDELTRQAQCSTLPPSRSSGDGSATTAAGAAAAASSSSGQATRIRGRGKALRRKKVAKGKGFSQMDWSRLHRRASPHELGVPRGGGLRSEVTLEELATHCTRDDLWMAIEGKVYNCTEYLGFHVSLGSCGEFRSPYSAFPRSASTLACRLTTTTTTTTTMTMTMTTMTMTMATTMTMTTTMTTTPTARRRL